MASTILPSYFGVDDGEAFRVIVPVLVRRLGGSVGINLADLREMRQYEMTVTQSRDPSETIIAVKQREVDPLELITTLTLDEAKAILDLREGRAVVVKHTRMGE